MKILFKALGLSLLILLGAIVFRATIYLIDVNWGHTAAAYIGLFLGIAICTFLLYKVLKVSAFPDIEKLTLNSVPQNNNDMLHKDF